MNIDVRYKKKVDSIEVILPAMRISGFGSFVLNPENSHVPNFAYEKSFVRLHMVLIEEEELFDKVKEFYPEELRQFITIGREFD